MSTMPRRTLVDHSLALALALPLGLSAGQAQAADPVLGAVVGAGIGAVAGNAISGRDGARVGVVVGGAVGAASAMVVSTQRPQAAQAGAYAMAPMGQMNQMAPAPRMTRVDYYDGGNIYYGPWPPPPRGPGQWRLMRDGWGNEFWQWEPAPVYLPPPVYTVPVYPPPPVYQGYYPAPRGSGHTPRWHGNAPAPWANPHRRGEAARSPTRPPAYRPPPPSYQPPVRTPAAPPPPRYQAPVNR